VKAARQPPSSGLPPSRELAGLRVRVDEAEEALRAIRGGEVDTVVVAGRQGDQVFTLVGAEQAYRVLIESMNEGALTLTTDKTILYANDCFARMVKSPLEQVTGGSLRRYLSVEDRTALRPLMLRTGKSGSKIQVVLLAGDGSRLPAQISIRPMAKNGFKSRTIGMVVTDLTETRRTEELLRALTHRVVRMQEAERERVALELHDNITQLLCAILFRSQALAEKLSARGGPARSEALKLRKLLGAAAEEVERISRNLRPGILDQLGLVAALRQTGREFAERTGVAVNFTGSDLTGRLPAEEELILFRIFQDALANVEKHARARHVAVGLTRRDGFAELAIHDDGIGFDPDRRSARRKGQGDLGLLGMRERAASLGGSLDVKSHRRTGTEIVVRLPLPALPSR
jgi:two-component system NarL family sensor kinase